ncbi:cytochrome P450 monooxygenase pc-3 [Hymenopellis radicata]|nr:cytochrome P450 monooxygenase pc-3 [Hymenopellis radicata]
MSFLRLPPGPTYILSQVLPPLVLRSIVTLASINVFYRYSGSRVPGWIYLAAIIFIHPLARSFTLWRRRYATRHDMLAKGAIAPPVVEATSRDIINTLVRTFTSGYPGEAYWSWALRYGNVFALDIFSEKRIVTIQPEHVKAILATQFHEFEKASLLLSQWKDLLGTGVFNADGDMWKFHRNMTRPFFSKDRISDFDNFERHTSTTIALMKERLREGHPVEFQDAVSRFTLDSATEYLFGKDVESLAAGIPYPKSSNIRNSEHFENHPSNVFVRAFVRAQELIATRTRYGSLWPLQEFWTNEVIPLRRTVDEFVEPLIKDAYKKKAAGESEKDGVISLVSELVNVTDDEVAIKDELLNILVAGRDTTASLITFGVYALSRNQDVTRKLREEINAVVGERAPTYDDIRNMKYLRAFLNEVLRLYPPVPFDSRTSNVATTLPNKDGRPYYIPKDTKVIYALFWLHRRVDMWGPTALEFDPDRFIDDRLKEYLVPNPFIFQPFNAGPRICLGQQFAYNEASYFLVRLLQSFSSFSIAEDAQTPEACPPKAWLEDKTPGSTKDRDTIMFGMHLTMYAKGGMWVRMTEDQADSKNDTEF